MRISNHPKNGPLNIDAPLEEIQEENWTAVSSSWHALYKTKRLRQDYLAVWPLLICLGDPAQIFTSQSHQGSRGTGIFTKLSNRNNFQSYELYAFIRPQRSALHAIAVLEYNSETSFDN
ncbi:hypothetical protein ACLOJK_024501 [Asimina triloba]